LYFIPVSIFADVIIDTYMYNECLYSTHIYAPRSAIDQLRKQFSHLEENDGKSGPVLPIERKHVSLPR
jgi:hypothetical protein